MKGIESFMQLHLLCFYSLFTTFSILGIFVLLSGILDTAIVDRGRNVVSGSRDGTARLWDCGRSACLGVIADCDSSINGVAVGAADNSINLGSPEQMPSKLSPYLSPLPSKSDSVQNTSFSIYLSFSFSSSSFLAL
jgi:WD40 repeat protein